MSYLDAFGNKIWANLMELITSRAGLITLAGSRARVFLFPLGIDSLYLHTLFISRRLLVLDLFVGCLATFCAPSDWWKCFSLALIPSISSQHVPEGYALANRLVDAMVALPFRDSVCAISICPNTGLCNPDASSFSGEMDARGRGSGDSDLYLILMLRSGTLLDGWILTYQ
ncbi:hypothetical protein DFH09DRAFT_1067880 [Mycena vulgaris]|nr:hypothetical protein DFH09DRAFT_1067880 [Mycena vulgaris]